MKWSVSLVELDSLNRNNDDNIIIIINISVVCFCTQCNLLSFGFAVAASAIAAGGGNRDQVICINTTSGETSSKFKQILFILNEFKSPMRLWAHFEIGLIFGFYINMYWLCQDAKNSGWLNRCVPFMMCSIGMFNFSLEFHRFNGVIECTKAEKHKRYELSSHARNRNLSITPNVFRTVQMRVCFIVWF